MFFESYPKRRKFIIFVVYTCSIYSKMALMFAQTTVVSSRNRVPARKWCGPACPKMYSTYIVVHNERTDRNKICWHFWPLMEEPLLLLLRPYIQTSIVEPFALETKQKKRDLRYNYSWFNDGFDFLSSNFVFCQLTLMYISLEFWFRNHEQILSFVTLMYISKDSSYMYQRGDACNYCYKT